MRSRRLAFIFLAFYLTFIGGSAYYNLIFPVRLFHHAFMTILLALWLFGRLRSGRGLPVTPLNPAIYAAFVVWIVTAVFSLDPRMAFENLWLVMLHTLAFFVLVDYFQRGRHRLIFETVFMMAAVVIIMTGLELASWYFGLGIIPGTETGWIDAIAAGFLLPLEPLRVSLAMNISTLLAGYVAPIITVVIGWALTARRRDYRRTLCIIAAILVAILILTFSRGGLLSLAAALSTFVALRFAQSQQVQRRASPQLLLGLAGAAGVVLLAGFMLVTLGGGRGSGDRGRLDMYRSAVDITVDYPVQGIGPGLYGRGLREYRDPDLARDKLASAHNAYLNTAAETGLPGIIVSAWLGMTFALAWWRTWRSTNYRGGRIRLEATFAALIGVGVHSMVDVFTTTPLVLMILALAAFCITGTRSVLDAVPRGPRWPVAVALLIMLAYGAWFIQTDRALIAYQRSLFGGDNALASAEDAASLDPYLNLYDLQIAYLNGDAVVDGDESRLDDAIATYERALALEPTWDTGWINLAALYERRGDLDTAIAHLERAAAINPLTPVHLHLARLYEATGTAAEDEIVRLYVSGLSRAISDRDRLPLSTFWTATPLRRAALEERAATLPVDWRYRIWSVHDPDLVAELVPENPQSAPEWWVAGEHALTVENDAVGAEEHFSEAIARDRSNGDYYVARARARAALDLDGDAHLDLDMAELLGTRFAYPNAVRAQLATDSEEIRRLLAMALPPRAVGQEFAAVLYGGRMSAFDYFPEMRFPGPGRAAMQPWYTLADYYLSIDNLADAERVYEAILAYAPDETEAQQRLDALTDTP